MTLINLQNKSSEYEILSCLTSKFWKQNHLGSKLWITKLIQLNEISFWIIYGTIGSENVTYQSVTCYLTIWDIPQWVWVNLRSWNRRKPLLNKKTYFWYKMRRLQNFEKNLAPNTLCLSFDTSFTTITSITWSKSREIIKRFFVHFGPFFLKIEG